MRRLWMLCIALGFGCSDDSRGSQVTTVDPTLTPGTSGGESSTTVIPDITGADTVGDCDADIGCQNQIDLLFIVDNSESMAQEQLNLARQFDDLIARLEALEDVHGNPAGADVNILVTTTDLKNPQCQPWVKPGYEASKGRPISSSCTDRLERFESYSGESFEHVCSEVCPSAAAPRDPFIHFDRSGHNVDGGDPAQALSCVGPQGVDGCGYEAPLEAMMQAINPRACWNDPGGCTDDEWAWVERPFLRRGAVLAVVIITDEADCSVKNYDVMTDDDFRERDGTNPVTTSAVCWNAGVSCTGYDATTGAYAHCSAADYDQDGEVVAPDAFDVATPMLQPISRYTDYLRALSDAGKDVIMLGILGVPEVTKRANVAPFHPIEGGVEALVYRDWRPEDILAEDLAEGIDTADKHRDFGIGPGCTGFEEDDPTVSTGQAIPPVRVREVCESLNRDDRVRCCIESICSTDFSPAIDCLAGIIQNVIQPEG